MDESHIEKLRAIAVEAYDQWLGVQMDLYRKGATMEESRELLEKAQEIMQKAHSEWVKASVELKIAGIKARGAGFPPESYFRK